MAQTGDAISICRRCGADKPISELKYDSRFKEVICRRCAIELCEDTGQPDRVKDPASPASVGLNLAGLRSDVKTIKSWVIFFGILAILQLIGGCILLLSRS